LSSTKRLFITVIANNDIRAVAYSQSGAALPIAVHTVSALVIISVIFTVVKAN